MDNQKPINPYRKYSVIWSVMEGDWEDLTVDQIAEVLDKKPKTIQECIWKIKYKTGYSVPYTKKQGGVTNNGREN